MIDKKEEGEMEELRKLQEGLHGCVCGGSPVIAIALGVRGYRVACGANMECWKGPLLPTAEEAMDVWA